MMLHSPSSVHSDTFLADDLQVDLETMDDVVDLRYVSFRASLHSF